MTENTKRWSIKDNDGTMVIHPGGLRYHIANNPGEVFSIKESCYRALMGMKKKSI